MTPTHDVPSPVTPAWPARLGAALLAVAVLLGGVWAYVRVQAPFPYYGTTYDSKPQAFDIHATDQDGRPFRLANLRGKGVAVFFGFTHCPNICPVTLAYLEKAREALPAELRNDLRVVFVTIDPERDTVPKIRDYVRYFGPSVIGLRAAPAGLKEIAGAFGVAYAKADVNGADYQMNHTTATYLIDREGRMRLVWDYTALNAYERVARDMQHVLEER